MELGFLVLHPQNDRQWGGGNTHHKEDLWLQFGLRSITFIEAVG